MTKRKEGARQYMSAEERKVQILEVATRQAAEQGLGKVSKVSVTGKLGISVTMVNVHYGTVEQLRRAVLETTVDPNIVADAIELHMDVSTLDAALVAKARQLLDE